METKPRPPALDHPLVPKVMQLMQRANVWLYQRTDGRIGGKFRMGAAFPHGVPVLLLTTIGRKSGEPRIAPLLYLKDGDRYVANQGLPDGSSIQLDIGPGSDGATFPMWSTPSVDAVVVRASGGRVEAQWESGAAWTTRTITAYCRTGASTPRSGSTYVRLKCTGRLGYRAASTSRTARTAF